MKVNSVTPKEKSTAEVIVEIPAVTFEAALEKSYKKNRGGIMVPGFRKGKAPRKIIERMYGASVFFEDAINAVAPDAFDHAVEAEGIKTVGQPSIDNVDVSDDKVLTLTFITGLYPEVVLGKYKGLSAEKTVESVKKKDIDTELEMLQKRNARIQAVKRKAKNGDTAVIDFEGFLEGVAFPGGKGEGHELGLGTGSFVPGFEEQVVGMKAGDEKEINITFPEDYAPDLAGKDVVFKVKCQEVKEQVLPELDDEFAKDVSEFDTMEDYKKDIKARLTKERTDKADEAFREAIIKQAVEEMTAEIPNSMVDHALDGMMRDFYYSISSQGMDPNQYLQMMGMDMEGFREGSRMTALARIQTGLLLDAVAEAEKVAVEEAEIEAEYARLAEQYSQDIEKIKQGIPATDLTEDIKRKKAADLIYDSAKEKKGTAKAADDADEAEEKAPAKKPAAKKTPAKKPAADEPAAEKKPAAKKTTTATEKKPAAKKPAAKKPAAKKESE
ncbi:MAG: trigger factor [Oscillospiraceae bacterium]|nr:trigger factor [Oscillospiraceae bacterium]